MNQLTALRYTSIVIIVLIATVLQTHLIISGDITWLMQVGKRLLAGGHYYKNFVEVNPPMAIYLYLIPVLLSAALPINFITSVTLYIFCVAVLSWSGCSYLLDKVFARSDKKLQAIFEIALAFAYFIAPAYAFGQREYFLVLLMLPYLILAVLRLQGRTLNRWAALFIGIIAGVGFNIKPFFLLPWFLIELYMSVKTKTLTTMLRSENLACLSLVIIYLVSIFLLTPQYITQSEDLLKPVYYLNFSMPWKLLITHPIVIASIILLAVYGVLRQKLHYQSFADLLALSIISMMINFFMQQTLWFYHLLPILMFDVLLLTLIATEYMQANNIFKMQIINRHLWQTLGMNCILVSLMAYLFFITINYIQVGFYLTKNLFDNPIYSIAKSAAGKPIYIFTSNIAINYPLVDYTQTYSTSAFPSLWLLVAASKLANTAKTPAQQQLAAKIFNFVRTTDVDNIIHQQPVLIFVQQYDTIIAIHADTNHLTTYTTTVVPSFAYINFFAQDNRFAKFWQNYHYKGLAGGFAVYELKH